jgi:UDP-glucose 4-epimerase
MKVIVTGGSGFLGSHVADELTKSNHEVTIFDRKKSNWRTKNQKMFVGNLLNKKHLENVIKKADVVFHFAALADLDKALNKPVDSININILGTVNVLELCKKHNIKRFVHASSIYVNSSEGGFYRSSKKAAEDYIEEYNKNYGLKYTILRFGSLYGKRSDDTNGVRKIVKGAVKNGKIIYGGSKNSVREYVHVIDAAKACVHILKKKYENKHINITGKKKIKVSTFLSKLSKMTNISKKIEHSIKKDTGHYTVSPFTFKPKKAKKFIFKSSINFNDGLMELINELQGS